MSASDSQDQDKMATITLARWDVVCGYCDGKGFEAEIQGYFTSSHRKKLPHFGSLCCCQGNVMQSIKKYNLPACMIGAYVYI